MLCDAHVHFIPPEISIHSKFYKGIWSDKGRLFDFLEQYNIDKAILVYPTADAYLKLKNHREICQIYNGALERILRENTRIVAAGIVDVSASEDLSRQVEDLYSRGFQGISLASSYEGEFLIDTLLPIFEVAEEHNMFLFVHPQVVNPIGFERIKDPLLMPVLEYSFDISMFLGLLMVKGILQRYKARFIFSSLGGVIPFLKDRLDRVYAMLRKREMVEDLGDPPSSILKNVYADTSGSPLKNIEIAIELFGEDNILWGSDYPVMGDIEQNLKMLDSLGRKSKEKITAKNLLKLLNINEVP